MFCKATRTIMSGELDIAIPIEVQRNNTFGKVS